MGQNNSKPSSPKNQLSAFKKNPKKASRTPSKTGVQKSFQIEFEDSEYEVEAKDDNLTCGWLLSEVIRVYKGNGTIVGLSNSRNIETLDYWLVCLERSLRPIKDGEKLFPVFAEEVKGAMDIGHFEPIKVVGKGGFSTVLQMRKKDTGMIYAVKVMSKTFILREEKVAQILTEKNALTKLQHPFIITLNWAFQSQKFLYLVMEFCPGGELFFHLHNLGRFTEDQARFYFAEILLGIEHLHNNNIVYRDLKPENVLLDLDGHVRLTDFGLCKENVKLKGRSYSFCGSPEYMSPEMLSQQGHGRPVDFYSLGALLFEMLTGLPPFYERNRSKMYHRIKAEEVFVPKFISKAAKDLLLGLLQKDPELRLGSFRGVEELKDHPWCEGVSWKAFLNKEVTPPFRPSMRRSNFDTEYTGKPLLKEEFFDLEVPAEDDPLNEFTAFERPKEHEVSQSASYASRSTAISRNASQNQLSSFLDDEVSYPPSKEDLSPPNRHSEGLEFDRSFFSTGKTKFSLSLKRIAENKPRQSPKNLIDKETYPAKKLPFFIEPQKVKTDFKFKFPKETSVKPVKVKPDLQKNL